MEFFPGLLSRAESDARVEGIRNHFAERGFGLWAVEAHGVAPFLGFVGLSVPPFEAHFTPCVEIGWRLAYEFWGRGYATEAARAALDFGFRQLGLKEIVSFTVPANRRSRSVMERIGMTHSPDDDFEHPGFPRATRSGTMCCTASTSELTADVSRSLSGVQPHGREPRRR